MALVAASSPEVLAEQRPGRIRRVDAGHLAPLTGYRGFAALVVLVVHAAGRTEYPWLGLHGYGPVALFTLSGYLLIGPWSKWAAGVGPRPSLRSFAKHRVARIFPPYLVALGVVAIIYPASRPRDGDSWLRAVTLTNFLRPDGLRPAMEHVWSMGTEFSWYFALPLIGAVFALSSRRLFPRHSHVVMIVIVAASAAATIWWQTWIEYEVPDLAGKLTYPMWLPAFLVCFMSGAMVKHLQLTRSLSPGGGEWLQRLAKSELLVLGVAGLAIAVLVSPYSGPVGYVPLTFGESNIRFAAGFALALILIVGISGGPASSRLRRWFSAPWLVATGRWSYGVYLWHLPVTVVLDDNVTILPGPMGLAVWLGVVAAVSVSLGALTYAWIEKPAIAWSKR